MISADKDTRDLLPQSKVDPEELIGAEMMFAGSLAPASGVPLYTVSSAAMQPAADLPPTEQEDVPLDQGSHEQPAAVLITGLAASINAPDVSHGPTEGSQFIPISVVEEASVLKQPPIAYGGGGAGGRDHREDGSDKRQPLPESDGARGGASHGPDGPHDISGEVDDAHSINVTQIAIVDQEASVMVSGYVGEVVARLHINQDLMMDQDVDISFMIDGDGHFALLLDQNMRIDQELEIDLKIFDVDGVLYVDLFLHDSIEIEQDTTLDMRISDGSPGGTVEVNQDIELDQEVDIDIDIEDELEERYIVEVNVESLQEIDAEQDAAVDVMDWNGEIDMDVYALQMAAVEQQTIVQADFSLA